MTDKEKKLPPRKVGLLQVAKTLCFGLLMIGKKETWEGEGDGARMTYGQIVVGAVIGGILLVAALVVLVRIALRLAGN